MPSLMELLNRRQTGFQVLSLSVRAAAVAPSRPQSQFEILVRHLFGRLLNNEAFGDDAGGRIAQLSYAVALPGVLVALFLFPAYHGVPPHPLERDYWSQACDHLFYVVYSFVVMGLTMIFEWDLLFPDLLDVYVLSALPMRRTRLLAARVSAYVLLLGLVHLGTSGLGNLFFPAVADLRCGFWRHVAAHGAAVTLGGLFIVSFLAFLQGLLVLVTSERFASRAAAFMKSLTVVLLLTMFFLFPLVAHSLAALLSVRNGLVLWFPPFWFLGVYECGLWGAAARPVFHELAATGISLTALFCGGSALFYPLAYRRRVTQLVEGSSAQRGRSRVGRLLKLVLDRLLARSPGKRATLYFAAQTLLRQPRLQLYLAMYAGLGLALVLSGVVGFTVSGDHLTPVVSSDGVRMAVPVVAFWTVAGLRTALLSPIGRQGSWLFRVIDGSPTPAELRGVTSLVATCAIFLVLATTLLLRLIAPPDLGGARVMTGQIVVGVGLCSVLTSIFFLRVRTIPFTAARTASTRELPLALVRYFVVFPALALTTVQLEPWIEASGLHLVETGLVFLCTILLLAWSKARVQRMTQFDEDFSVTSLGLHDQ